MPGQEQNLGGVPLRFMQIWILPRESGLEPAYGGYDGTTPPAKAARQNQLQHLVGDKRADPSTCVGGALPPVLIEQARAPAADATRRSAYALRLHIRSLYL